MRHVYKPKDPLLYIGWSSPVMLKKRMTYVPVSSFNFLKKYLGLCLKRLSSICTASRVPPRMMGVCSNFVVQTSGSHWKASIAVC